METESPPIRFRALEPSDAELLHRWRQDPAYRDGVTSPHRFVSLDTERRWVERAIGEHERGDAVRLMIVRESDDQAIGFLWFTDIDWINRSASAGIGIGEPVERATRRAIIDAVGRLGLGYAFRQLGLMRVQARVREDNVASRSLCTRIGFREEGLLRSAAYKNGAWVNIVVYGLLRSDWSGDEGSVPEPHD